MSSPEQYTGGAERGREVENAAGERLVELREQQRNTGEKHDPNAAEHEANAARHEAEKQAKTAEDYRPAAEIDNTTSTYVSARTREKSYQQTMKNVQREMSAPERAFSKVIHNKSIEKASDVIATTVARPTSILTGAITAFLAVGGLYILARQIGFSLQGSETILAFILGWIAGLAFDLLRIAIRRKR